MGGSKKRDRQATHADDGDEEALISYGKQLLGLQKTSKDVVLKPLKAAARILEDAPQTSEGLQTASTNLCKALAKSDLLKHKDKEVRLFATVCAIHTLRLHAPDNPYTDAQLATIFRQLLNVFRALADPRAPHYQACLSLLETTAAIRVFLLALDLDSADDLVLDLFTVIFDAIDADNRDAVERHALSLLAGVLEEADNVSQQLLDVILGHLLPAVRAENPAAFKLAVSLVRQCQPTLQPPIQRFLTRLLDGERTDSDLTGSSSELVLEMYRAAPQIMLPVLPHLEPGLQVDSEERRLDAVDLICRLLTNPGAHTILEDYPQLWHATLRRLNDRSPEVRARIVSHAVALANALGDGPGREEVVREVALRLQDPDERLRAAAAGALCAIAAEHPSILRSSLVHALGQRLRDKRLAVRKEVAAHVARLVRTWCLMWEADGATPERRRVAVGLAMGLVGVALTKDAELAAYVMDDLFKSGVFPAKLPPASAAAWWAELWSANDGAAGPQLAALLRGKVDLQRKVQDALRLREEAKEEERAAGAALGLGAAAASPGGRPAAERLAERLAAVAAALPDVHRAEEGLTRLFAMKDNHIFRQLGILAAYGTPLSDAAAATKEVQSRVATRGPASDVTAALAARMSPNLVPPEVLGAALAGACDCPAQEALVRETLAAAPQLYARQLPALTGLLESDDAMAAEVGARVLAAAGSYIAAAQQAAQSGDEGAEGAEKGGVAVPEAVLDRLKDLALTGTPPGAKAAVRALLRVLGPDAALPALRDICTQLLSALRDQDTLAVHSRTLAALKAVAAATRALPELLSELALDLYDCVMNHLMHADLSRGRPLSRPSTGIAATPGAPAPGTAWARPSPDVEIKAAALRTLAQALVPDDPIATVSSEVTEVVTALVAALGDLTDLDPTSDAFSDIKMHLEEVKWRNMGAEPSPSASGDSSGDSDGSAARGRKRKALEDDGDDEERPGTYDWAAMTPDERMELESNTASASPDAGWVRAAAASALLRLSRAHDALMTGNDYLAMGLACQDPIAEVRWALLDKVTATVSYFLRSDVAMPQRGAKAAALYCLYAYQPRGDPASAALVGAAFGKLRDYVAARRGAVERAAAAAAAAGAGSDSGTLINQMPEFILPFLVFFMAHHPDYDPELLYQEGGEVEVQSTPAAVAMGLGGGEPGAEDEGPAILVFCRCVLQMALEALLLPSSGSAGGAGAGGAAVDPAAEVARQAGASLKILRHLKFCDVLEVNAVRGEGVADEGATLCAHQICDMALYLARQLLKIAMGERPQALQKFPGQLALPKLCFRPRKDLAAGDKRRDGSDLPRGFRPVLTELFTAKFSPGTPGAVRKKPRGRTRPRAAGEEPEVQQQRPAGRSKAAGAAPARKRTKPAPREPKPAASPLRQQPRRGAKDVAGEKLLKAADTSSDDESEDMDVEYDTGSDGGASPDEATPSPAAAAAVAKPAAGRLALPSLVAPVPSETPVSPDSAGWGDDSDSPGQENGDKGNDEAMAAAAAAAAAAKAAAGGARSKRAKA